MDDPSTAADEWLVLVPTDQERQLLDLSIDCNIRVELCGFGPIAAALMAGRWIDRIRPRRVLLAGIAGAFEPESIGACFCFRRVTIDGVGARNEDDATIGPRQLGIAQLARGGLNRGKPVYDMLPLETIDGCPSRDLVLTVCAASGSPADALQRHGLYSGVFAEEMEGFGVALACHAAGIPLTIIRGMSNRAGDRDRDHWQMDQCLAAVRQVVLEQLCESD